MGLPALDTPLPPYRMTRTLPVTTATCKPLEDAVGLASVPACSVRRRRRWSTKAPMHWPVQNTRQEVEQDRIQCPEDAVGLASVPACSVRRRRRWSTKAAMHWPVQNTRQEVVQNSALDTPPTPSVQCSSMPRTPPMTSPSSTTSEFSVQCSPTPRTPPMTSPSSTTSEFSGLSMDSAYQDFCSRRDAFLAQCCRLV